MGQPGLWRSMTAAMMLAMALCACDTAGEKVSAAADDDSMGDSRPAPADTIGSDDDGAAGETGDAADSGDAEPSCQTTLRLRIAWQHYLGEGLRRPALGPDDVLYAAYGRTLVALDAATGFGGMPFEPENADDRYVLDPVVAPDGTVLAIYLDQMRLAGRLYALTPFLNDVRWSVGAPNFEANLYGPLAVDSVGHVFAAGAAANGQRGLASFGLADGQTAWFLQSDASIFALTVGPEGTVYAAGNEGTLLAVHPLTGRQLWRHQVDSDILAPAFGPDGQVYLVTSDGRIRTLAAADGSLLSEFITPLPGPPQPWNILSAPITGPDGILYAPLGGLSAVAVGQASIRWTWASETPLRAPVFGGAGQLFVSTGDQLLQGLDLVGGSATWQFAAQGGFVLEFPAAIIGPAETLYYAGGDGNMYALDSSRTARLPEEVHCVPCERWCPAEGYSIVCLPDGSGPDEASRTTCQTGQGCIFGDCQDCTPQAQRSCSEGAPYWYDACFHREERIEDCQPPLTCQNGYCSQPNVETDNSVCHCFCTCDAGCILGTRRECLIGGGEDCASCQIVCRDVCSTSAICQSEGVEEWSGSCQ